MAKDKKKFKVKERPVETQWHPESEQRYAAVDIGSNGVRLLLSKVITSGKYITYTKESLVRMPIRLGADVFTTGSISPELSRQLVSTMVGFKHLIETYAPTSYKACATSAMREAKNGNELAQEIRDASQLDLQIIDGGEEAELIFASHVADALDSTRAYLYIDVGGGSTELTYFVRGEKVTSRSFPIGTVRLLNGQVSKSMWKDMKSWVKSNLPDEVDLHAIGSGGNMNKLFRLSGNRSGKPVSYKKLKQMDKLVRSYDFEERIRILQLRPDRADVITHASEIFTSIMKWGKIKKIHVPQFGLADGLVHVMHEEYVRTCCTPDET